MSAAVGASGVMCAAVVCVWYVYMYVQEGSLKSCHEAVNLSSGANDKCEAWNQKST